MSENNEYRALIGGEWVEGANGTHTIVDPATEEIVGHAPEVDVAQAEAACAAAADAFGAWSRTRPEQRAELLDRAADLIDERAPELIDLYQAETGATLKISRQIGVPQAAARLRRYAKGAMESRTIPLPPNITEATPLAPGGVINALVNRAPVGVVSCITSYNFPMVNMAGKIGPALAMGNTVVIKPAPQDPLSVLKMVEILDEAGFPPGVVNVVSSEAVEPSATITSAPEVDMVSFTGSTSVGQIIGGTAGARNKRLLLELGGKGACIVTDDADLKDAAMAIASVWGFHSGQVCTAPTRVIAHRSVQEELVASLEAAAAFMPVGDPRDKRTIVGPLITDTHRDTVEGFIRSATDEGGELVVGGDRPDLATGFFVNPTLFANCTNEMRAVREEIFGPVVVVVPYDDDDEAIAISNDSEYGLYDYVFSGDSARAMGIAKQLRAGNVGINTLQRNHEAPFGGFKQSGVGRDGGSYGLHAYSEMQSIVWPS